MTASCENVGHLLRKRGGEAILCNADAWADFVERLKSFEDGALICEIPEAVGEDDGGEAGIRILCEIVERVKGMEVNSRTIKR